jgi:hypothetical protein
MLRQQLVIILCCFLLRVACDRTQEHTCLPCEEGMPCFASLVNRTEETCPPFSRLLMQSDNSSECVCDPGFFIADWSCVRCVAGYYCPGFYADDAYTDGSMTRRRLLSAGSDIVPCQANSSLIMVPDNVSMCWICYIGMLAALCSGHNQCARDVADVRVSVGKQSSWHWLGSFHA